MNTPPFHPFTEKQVGDAVKIARNPLDESKGFVFGRVTNTEVEMPYTRRLGILVTWEEIIPYLGDAILLPGVAIMA